MSRGGGGIKTQCFLKVLLRLLQSAEMFEDGPEAGLFASRGFSRWSR
jgi:hypothetical protein